MRQDFSRAHVGPECKGTAAEEQLDCVSGILILVGSPL